MKFDELLHCTQNLALFDLPTLVQISQTPKAQLRVQLSRWMHDGKLIGLRRGLYSLAESYRRQHLNALQVANELYRPSYVSGALALSFYGLIPEKVVLVTSVTTRVTRRFSNPLGTFSYSHIKSNWFWGFTSKPIDDTTVWIAEPEKALLDYFHLTRGEWSEDRLIEMRFQNFEEVDMKKLYAYAVQWGSPRLTRAVKRLEKVMEEESKGYREL